MRTSTMRSISVGRLGEKYYLMIVIDGIDFLWAQICKVRTNPEDLMREALHSANVAHDETDQLSAQCDLSTVSHAVDGH